LTLYLLVQAVWESDIHGQRYDRSNAAVN